jgi:AraC-like DNA-binding protein
VPHAIDMPGAVTMKTLYLAPRLARRLPRACRVLHVSPLLEALTVHACELKSLRGDVPAERHLIAVLIDQLEASPSVPLQLPMPRDARALRVADRLIQDPATARDLDQLCRLVGASPRTIERLFVDETGMTYGKWRQQLSLVHGARMILGGAKVTAAAYDSGYESPSAFIAMFRRALGVTPARWLEQATPPPPRPSSPRASSRRDRTPSPGP